MARHRLALLIYRFVASPFIALVRTGMIFATRPGLVASRAMKRPRERRRKSAMKSGLAPAATASRDHCAVSEEKSGSSPQSRMRRLAWATLRGELGRRSATADLRRRPGTGRRG